VGSLSETLREVARYARPGTVITDTGSTKGEIHAAARHVLPPSAAVFVGGHPLAGSEASGVRSADPYLFENAFYILTADDDTPAQALGLLEGLVRRTGAFPHRMSPSDHDRLVAAISHLPHSVAAALVNAAVRVAGSSADFLRFAAGGFRDTTRVAGGSPALWRQILLSNAPQVLEALEALGAELDVIRKALAERDGETLEAWLDHARRNREAVPRRRTGLLAPFPQFVVQVEDRPGAIAGVTQVLAEAEVNLREIEILHLREGEGGSLLIGVDSDEAMLRSIERLQQAGYSTRSRG
jgi:prephenate dehydrogenase